MARRMVWGLVREGRGGVKARLGERWVEEAPWMGLVLELKLVLVAEEVVALEEGWV